MIPLGLKSKSSSYCRMFFKNLLIENYGPHYNITLIQRITLKQINHKLWNIIIIKIFKKKISKQNFELAFFLYYCCS